MEIKSGDSTPSSKPSRRTAGGSGAGLTWSPEQNRQCFRSLDLGESSRPFAMAQQLQDSCRKWLLAEGCDVDHIIDLVWLRCHHPTSLDSAIHLAEDHMVVGETEPGPLRSVSGEPSEIERLIHSERDDFPLEQTQDETLKRTFEQVRTIDG
uniref:SCAN box domain-containing protein n=1 Tax=Cyprinus carpio carpio TaxID=630221 RepID=A0A9J7XH16_CYPCA